MIIYRFINYKIRLNARRYVSLKWLTKMKKKTKVDKGRRYTYTVELLYYNQKSELISVKN